MGSLTLHPAKDRTDLLADPVVAMLEGWSVPADEVAVAQIDPDLADTVAFCEAYDVELTESANCVVVAGRRSGETRMAACLVLATTRADINNVVRKRLDVRKVSFAPMDVAVAETGMEYGGITPVGLPDGWPILIDAAVVATPRVLIGSGVRRSKLVVPGPALAELPGAEVIDGLGK